MSNLALQRIAENKRTKALSLDLGNCGLNNLPPQIKQLDWLEELILSNEFWDPDKNEWVVNVNKGPKNRRIILSTLIHKLTNLKRLYINGDRRSSWQVNLTHIDKLSNLEYLDCSQSKISNFGVLASLPKLQYLNILNTNVPNLGALANAVQLKRLNCSNTSVRDLGALANLSNLNIIEFADTQINDLTSLSNLPNLEIIDCSYTMVDDLSCLKNLSNLKEINCENTLVTRLKPLTKIASLLTFKANGCLIEDCPPDVWQSGDARQLRAHFEGLAKIIKTKNPEDNRRDVKLILLGNSNTGKTNFVHFLETGEYLGKRNSTHGMEVKRWLPDIKRFPKLSNISVSIWDFGGQEYYHGSYRLFLSDNAVYIVFWSKDTEINGKSKIRLLDGGPEVYLDHFEKEYWLDTVRYYGFEAKNAPLFVVQNKTDDLDSDRSQIDYDLKMYNIQESFHVSIKKGCLKDDSRQIARLQAFTTEIEHALATKAEKNEGHARPDWQRIRNIILSLREDVKAQNPFSEFLKNGIWIDLSDFYKVCQIIFERNLTPDETYALPRWLDRGGVAVFFPDIPNLSDWLFLRPDLLTEKIYHLLGQQIIEHNGKITDEYLDKIDDQKIRSIFLEITKHLELILPYTEPESKTCFISPQYLPESHGFEALFNIAAHTAMQSTFWLKVPLFYYKKILHGLLLHYVSDNDTELRHFWKHGIVLLKNNLIVLIKGLYLFENEKNGVILIGVAKSSDSRQKKLQREIFANCLNILNRKNSLHEEMPKPSVKKNISKSKVAKPQSSELNEQTFLKTIMAFQNLDAILNSSLDVSIDGKHYIQYTKLLSSAQEGNAKISIAKGEKLPIRYFSPLLPDNTVHAKRVFLSYSHQNTHWLLRLRTHLSGLRQAKEIEDWTDMEILPGELWGTKIKENIEFADVYILLLSADFIASDYIRDVELPEAFEKLKTKNAKIIPVLVEPLDLGGLPYVSTSIDGNPIKISDIEIVPKDEKGHLKAISLWENQEEALSKVAIKIRIAIQQI